VLKDRIVAVVDEDPILVSDLDRAIALGFSQRRAGEAEPAFRRRALEELIADRLRFHEIDRFGFEVPVSEIDEHVEAIRARFGSDAEFHKTLASLGLSREAVRQMVARQLLVTTYVEERLGPKVFIDAESINRHYRAVLTPQMKRLGKNPPPLEAVRDDIRKALSAERLNQEIETWTRELKAKADIANYLDSPLDKLPPVVKKIGPKPKKPKS